MDADKRECQQGLFSHQYGWRCTQNQSNIGNLSSEYNNKLFLNTNHTDKHANNISLVAGKNMIKCNPHPF